MDIEKNNVKIVFNILAIMCIVVFCISITPLSQQNDTFYTVKVGELIVNNGIDFKDHFSWHEDLPYTYPHWAYDVGMYFIYHLGEISGIAEGGMLFIYISTVVLTATLGILIYITMSKVSKNQLISFLLTIFIMYLFQDYITARAQMVTFNLFVLTILFIESFLESNKKRYLLGLIIISIIIANVHVAVWPFFFVLFMPYVAEYIIATILEKNIISKLLILYRKKNVEILENRLNKIKDNELKEKITVKLEKAREKLEKQEQKENRVIEKRNERREKPYKLKIMKNKSAKWLILVLIVCAFTGLLTPLKDVPYTYLVKTMQGNTTQSISEHLPLTLYNEIDMMIVMAVIFVVLIFTDVKIRLSDFFMVAGLIFLSFMSRRQTSLLLIIGAVSFVKWIEYLAEKYDKEGSFKLMKFMTTLIGKIITIAVIMIISVAMMKPKLEDSFINENKYPVAAATWILENLDIESMKLYNEYNYGSYLLYRGIPVFIDSRADLYAPEFNKKEDEEEGRDIFSDYMSTSSIGSYYETKFKKYGITHVIVVNNAKLNMFLARDNKYKELYKDDNFVIYERNV